MEPANLMQLFLVLLVVVIQHAADGQSNRERYVCPPPINLCKVECTSNYYCEGRLRCCSTGCGYTCQEVEFKKVKDNPLTTLFITPRQPNILNDNDDEGPKDGSSHNSKVSRKTSTSTSLPWFIYIIIGGTVMLAILVIVIAIVLYKNFRKKPVSTSPVRRVEADDVYCYIQDPLHPYPPYPGTRPNPLPEPGENPPTYEDSQSQYGQTAQRTISSHASFPW